MDTTYSTQIITNSSSKAQFRRRTFHEPNLFEFGSTQINKRTPVDSDVELNSPKLIQFEPKLLVKKPKTETACKIHYIEITPWKMRAYDFYSRVEEYQKTNE